MKTILYNQNTKQLSRIYENGYNLPIREPYMHELEVVDVEPTIGVNQWLTSEWIVDLENKQYKRVYTIHTKTAHQIAMQDWHEPDYAKRIRASVELLDPVNPDISSELSDVIHKLYNYLLAQGLPEYEAEGEKMIYINVVKEQHSEFAKSIEGITIDDIPNPKDFE